MIEDFLDETIVDFYCQMRKVEGLSDEEIDNLFLDFEGNELNDKDFINEHIDDINEVVIDEVYVWAKENSKESDISLKALVSFLASRLLLFSYNHNHSNMICYLLNTNIDKIVNFFKEDDRFGRFMIKGYLDVMLNSDEYEEVKERLSNDKEMYEKLLSFEKEENRIIIRNINEILRGVICNLYDHYISYGCNTVTALDNIWAYFIRDFDPLGELNKMGASQNEKEIYKKWMLNLIFADLFEDINNKTKSNIKSNSLDSLNLCIEVLVLSAISYNAVCVPKDIEVRNNILYKFLILCDEKERFLNNRKNSYKKGTIELLKKVNPTYKLDELTFLNKK